MVVKSKILKEFKYFARAKKTKVLKPDSLAKLEIRVTDGIARKKGLTDSEADEVIEMMPKEDIFNEKVFYVDLDRARNTAKQSLGFAAGKTAQMNTTVREQAEGKEYIKERRYLNKAS